MTPLLSPGNWLRTRSEQTSRTSALLFGGRGLDYGQLADEASALARYLEERGVCRGQVVAAQLASAQQLARLLYAALHLGVTLLPLDPGLADRRRDRLLTSVRAQYLVSPQAPADAGFCRLLPEALFADRRTGNAVPISPPQPLEGDQVQLIIATSGTTGEPKGVMLSAANLAASAAASEQRLGLQAGDCWLACLPLFHIGGLSILLRCLAAGARVQLEEGFDAARVWQQIEAGAVTHLSLVPAMLERLLSQSAGRMPPATLRVVLIGGGPLSRALAQRAHAAGWPLCVSYGMSETASQFATDCSPQAGLAPGRVGLPLAGYEVTIGEAGRIRVRGPAVMQGYANPRGMAGLGLKQGWFETGDLGSLDEQGRLTVIGRADDLLVSGGKNIHPAEVEERLLQCPGVGAVGVTGRPDPVWGVTLVALFTGEVTAGDLEQWVRQHLPGHLRPREFMRIKALPLNRMGKLSRQALRELLPQSGSASEHPSD
ncbi:o-succinylbenzoate--CoA ligase [Sedimenticola sp.]|uniref:o-succinylbenzoate--CoA ligase n=1 Tax=Sedimenticola sp. TaxID=1940285 RepID=UPI002582569F|nr:o-succinylbenzoate--CoA ligase [Sedimenticola sp.]MCW8903630.1 o-succinylbenzoate--CoA ligase [Sedimenticola sp.]